MILFAMTFGQPAHRARLLMRPDDQLSAKSVVVGLRRYVKRGIREVSCQSAQGVQSAFGLSQRERTEGDNEIASPPASPVGRGYGHGRNVAGCPSADVSSPPNYADRPVPRRWHRRPCWTPSCGTLAGFAWSIRRRREYHRSER